MDIPPRLQGRQGRAPMTLVQKHRVKYMFLPESPWRRTSLRCLQRFVCSFSGEQTFEEHHIYISHVRDRRLKPPRERRKVLQMSERPIVEHPITKRVSSSTITYQACTGAESLGDSSSTAGHFLRLRRRLELYRSWFCIRIRPLPFSENKTKSAKGGGRKIDGKL